MLGHHGVLFVSSTIFIAICLWLLLRTRRRNFPPGPLNFPVLGSIPYLGKLPHISLLNLSKKYGDIMYLKFGTTPVVVLSSIRAATELYKMRGSELASNRPVFRMGKYISFDYSGLVFTEYSPQWKLRRKIANSHLLSHSRLKAYAKDVREEVLKLVQSILHENGKAFKLMEKLHVMNINVAGRLLLYRGEPDNQSTNESLKNVFVESVKIIGATNLGDVIPALRSFDLQGLEKHYKRIGSKIEEILYSILQERRSTPPALASTGPPPLIDSLISLDSTPDEVPDRSKLAILSVSHSEPSEMFKLELLQDLLLGAVDTPAVTIEWGMTELLRRRELLEKARREIKNVVGDQRLVDESDMPQLPLIQAIAKETLRLHSPAPLALPKAVLGGSTTLGGYTIPEKSWIYVNFHAVGTDEEFWEEPLEFKPERFLEGKAKEVDVFGQHFCLLPFGSGKRICPGAKLGFDVVAIGIATLIQGFEWKSQPEGTELDMGVTYGVVCSKSEPLVTVAMPVLSFLQ